MCESEVAQSCPTLPSHALYSPWNSPGWDTGAGSLSLLQGIFPTKGSNPGLPHCRHILYQLSHQGKPCFIHTSVHLPTQVSQFIPPAFPSWYPYVCSLHLRFYFCFANKFIYVLLLFLILQVTLKKLGAYL